MTLMNVQSTARRQRCLERNGHDVSPRARTWTATQWRPGLNGPGLHTLTGYDSRDEN